MKSLDTELRHLLHNMLDSQSPSVSFDSTWKKFNSGGGGNTGDAHAGGRRKEHGRKTIRRLIGETASIVAAIAVVAGAFTIYEQHQRHLDGGSRSELINSIGSTGPDEFSSSTLSRIQSALNDYHVSANPLTYEVYVLTGGLGTPNPQLISWGSTGDMTFETPPATFRFLEMSQNPALWGVPWKQKHTSSGFTYYEWHTLSDLTQFYFKMGSTYINVRVTTMNAETYPFPQGIIKYLKPVGNPVQHLGNEANASKTK